MSNKFYVKDTTIGQFVYFNSVNELVNYLGNSMVPRATGGTRAQFVQNLIDLGHGYDDNDGVMLTRALSETFDIGIVRENTHVRTDVHEATRFTSSGYGD